MPPKTKSITIKAPTYNIGDRVYYNLPEVELPMGLVISVVYYLELDEYEYCVSFGGESTDWCSEIELSENKVF